MNFFAKPSVELVKFIMVSRELCLALLFNGGSDSCQTGGRSLLCSGPHNEVVDVFGALLGYVQAAKGNNKACSGTERKREVELG